MRLNHRQLEAFRAIMQTGSVTDAAARIFVTQPAASRLLADLESAVGYPLFKRIKNRMHPTREGLALFEEVDRSYIGLDVIAEAAREISKDRRGSLFIVGMPALALEFLPSVIAEFCNDRPEVSVTLHIYSSQRVQQCVASQQYDFGFAEIDTPHPAVTSEILLSAPMVAILPKNHHLTTKTTLTPRDLEGESFASLGSQYMMRKKVDAVFEAANVKRRMQIETQLSAAIGQIVAKGGSVALIDPISAVGLHAAGLVEVRPFEPAIIYNYRVLFPKHRVSSQLGQTFLGLVRKACEQIEGGFAVETPKA